MTIAERYGNILALIGYLLFFILFSLDLCAVPRSLTNPRYLRLAITIIIMLEISYPLDRLLDNQWIHDMNLVTSIIFDLFLPIVLSVVILRIFNNYYTLRYLKLPYIVFVCCIMYTTSWWISIPIEIFAMIDDNNIYYKAVNRYYVLTWIMVEFIVFCCLIAIIIKLKRMLSRTHQYQSMFVIDKDANVKSKQSVEIKLKCWMFIVSLLAIYFFFIMAYYVSITYIFKGQFDNNDEFTETFSCYLFILAHLSLNITLYFYTHSGYRFDAIIDSKSTRTRTNTWVASMISARADTYAEAEDIDDNELEFSLSETSTVQPHHDYTQIMYMEDTQ